MYMNIMVSKIVHEYYCSSVAVSFPAETFNTSSWTERSNCTQQNVVDSIAFSFVQLVNWLSQYYTYFWLAFIAMIAFGCIGNLWALLTLHLSNYSPEHFKLTLPYFTTLFAVDFLMDAGFGVNAYLENGLGRLIQLHFPGLENLSEFSCKLTRCVLVTANSYCNHTRTHS